MRRFLFLAILFSWTPAAFVAVAFRPPVPEPGVTTENLRRIWVGMKEHDVEALFGEPGRSQPLGFSWKLETRIDNVRKGWVGDGFTVFLFFDREQSELLAGLVCEPNGKCRPLEEQGDNRPFARLIRWLTFSWQTSAATGDYETISDDW